MIAKYSSMNRFERPSMFLCNPGCHIKDDGSLSNCVGMIANSEAEEIIYNFNTSSELNLRVNRITLDNEEEQTQTDDIYNKIKNRRLIYVQDIGLFVIKSVAEGYDGSIDYKDISASSIESEAEQRGIPFVDDGTYRFSTDGQEDGLFDTIIEKLPLWRIGNVDISVASRYRTFQDVDTSLSCLEFMINNMQEAYECIFDFDIINRIINVYDQNSYVNDTSVHITKDDFINTINATENADELFTALTAKGDSDVTIAAVNPLGTTTIYNFSYYLDWMSSELSAKVSAWQGDIRNSSESYYNDSLQYYTQLENVNNIDMEIKRLNQQISIYKKCRDNIVAESSTELVDEYNEVINAVGGTSIDISVSINETLSKIDDLITECTNKLTTESAKLDSANASLEEIKARMDEVNNRLAMNNYFTNSEVGELSYYIFDGEYQDDYVIITEDMTYTEKFQQIKEMYDRCTTQLNRVSTPTIEFDVDVDSFIFAKEFEQFAEQIATGCIINVEINDNEVIGLFLSNVTVNYEEATMSMTFGNRINRYDTKSLYEDALGQVSKSASSISYIKEAISPIRNGGFNDMKEEVARSRNLSMADALASDNEDVVIDKSGYTGRRVTDTGEFDPRQVKIIGRRIVFTDDAWETSKVAVGEILFQDGSSSYGINAESIIGDIIIGRNLNICDSNGNSLLNVVDGKISTYVENELYGDADGLKSDGSDSIAKQISQIKQTADSIEFAFSSVTTENADGTVSVDVDKIITSTGYRFDKDGLVISKNGTDITNKVDNTGLSVSRGDDEVLRADNNGVVAINLTAKSYLTVGDNGRFENYISDSGERRTACFYIEGGE